MKKGSLLFMFWAFALGLKAQTGTWQTLNLRMKLDDHWSLFAETQLRSLAIWNRFHYTELKGGFNWSPKKDLSFAAGSGRFTTYSGVSDFSTPLAQDEIRVWQQMTLRNRWADIGIDHRYRIEQRFTSRGYRNRFRYRLALNKVLVKDDAGKTKFQLTGWSELFLGNQQPYFERVRWYGGAEYHFSKSFATQIGYTHQFDYRINDETGRGLINLTLLFELDFKGKPEPTIHID
jgi:hypothetical protein